LLNDRGAKTFYHFNGITSWGINEHGDVRNVYA